MIRSITRPFAVLGAASVAMTAALGLAATSATAFVAGPSDNGLFGAADPTYDGAYRQSLGLLAFAAAGEEPPASAIGWLLDQQCDNGGWQSYRADASKPCAQSDPVNFTGPDTNSTAIALEALAAVDAAGELNFDPTDFLKSAQNTDGGFGYYLGGTSDPNSTALVLQAIISDGQSPTAADWTKGGKTGLDYLTSQQVTSCDNAGEFGGIKSPFSDGHADTYASLQSVPALAQKAFPLTPVATLPSAAATPCPYSGTTPLSPSAATTVGAAYLSGVIGSDGVLKGFDGKANVSNTAYGVLALSAAGVGDDAKRHAAADWLITNGAPATANSETDNPGELALIVLANLSIGVTQDAKVAHATTSQISALLDRLADTARVINTLGPTPTPTPTDDSNTSGSGGSGTGTTGGVTPVATPTLPVTGASHTTVEAILALALLAAGSGLVVTSRRVAARSKA